MSHDTTEGALAAHVMQSQRGALRAAMLQIDASTTGVQARAVLAQMIDDIDHELHLLTPPADAELARLIADDAVEGRTHA